MKLIYGGSGSGTNYFPPAPGTPSSSPGGLAGMLQGLLGGGPSALQRSQSPNQPQTPMRRLLDPDVALPMAAALMGGQGNAANFGNAFAAAGPAIKRNRTVEFLKGKDPELAEMMANGLEPKDAYSLYLEKQKLSGGSGKAPQVEQFFDDAGQPYKAQWDGKAWQKVGGSKGDEGFEITTADGTVIRQGAFGKQDEKNVANRISEEQEGAKAASTMKATVQMLRKASTNVGYSGPGAGLYGVVDDTAEQLGAGGMLPGNARSRATMRSGGVDIVLANVQKMKGAVSDKETAMLMGAAPGMAQTPEGNTALLDIADAMADRQLMRTGEAEKWRQDHGTLDGFESAWGEYVIANPLMVDDGQGSVALNGSTGAAAQTPNSGGVTAPDAASSIQKTQSGVSWRVKP